MTFLLYYKEESPTDGGFGKHKKFEKLLDSLDGSVRSRLWSVVQRFEKEWARAQSTEDIRKAFNFKEPAGPKLSKCHTYQIYGPGKKYRLTLCHIANGNPQLRWTHLWHKHSGRDPQEVLHAQKICKDLCQN